MSREIHRSMVHGAFWMVLFKFFERSLGVISTMILVRLLSPADFGIVGMALSFVLIAELMTTFGFDTALIQRQDAPETQYHTAWTCNVLLGLLIGAAMLAAAPAISVFYRQPQLFWVVCALALGPVISGLENIGVVAFRKDLQFRREFAFQLSRKVFGFLVVVPLAYYLRSYWALVAGILAAKLAGTVISYLSHPFRPRFSLHNVRGLLRFSQWLLLNNIVGTFKERSSDFFVGRMLGAASLGVYTVTYEIARMPSSELSAPINRALLPGFSKLAHDGDAMRALYRGAIGMLALLALPAAAGICALAPFIVPTLLGPKWIAGVPLMELLSIHGGILFFHSSICTVLIASGHPDRAMKTNTTFTVIMLALFALLIPIYGLIGAAWGSLGASIVTTPLYLFQIRRSIGTPAMLFVQVAVRPICAAAVMAGLVRWTLPAWSPAMGLPVAVAWTLAGVAMGIAVYAATIFVLWSAVGRPPGAEYEVTERLRLRLTKRGGAATATAS